MQDIPFADALDAVASAIDSEREENFRIPNPVNFSGDLTLGVNIKVYNLDESLYEEMTINGASDEAEVVQSFAQALIDKLKAEEKEKQTDETRNKIEEFVNSNFSGTD